MDERIACALVMSASVSIIASVLTRSPEPEAVEPTPTCAWPTPNCSSQPPKLEVAWLRDLRAAKWGKR